MLVRIYHPMDDEVVPQTEHMWISDIVSTRINQCSNRYVIEVLAKDGHLERSNFFCNYQEASDFKDVLDSVCSNNTEPSSTGVFLENHSDKVCLNR